MAFLFISACSVDTSKQNEYESCDTITLPFSSMKASKIYFHPFFNKTMLTFIQESPLEIVLIDPETLKFISFPLDEVINYALNLSNPAAYYVIDSNLAIISFMNMKGQFFKIKRDGSIHSIIPIIDKRKNQEYGLYYYSTLIPFPNQHASDTITLVENFTADFPGSHLYITDKSIRNRKFSAKTNLLIKIADSSIVVTDEIGSYPPELINSKNYYYLEPRFCVSPDNKIINIFPSINKIGYTTGQGKTNFQDFKVPNTSETSLFNTESIMDYRYISQYTYENCIWVYLYSDFTEGNYYAISIMESEYINPDGTTNEPRTSPWALVTMDKSLNIIRTDFFPKDDLSKHTFFFSSNYFFIQSNTLTQKNSEKFLTFIKYKKPALK